MVQQESVPGEARALRYHGGNIKAATRLFPNAPRPWIDLSTGINPVPYPVGSVPPSAWTRLPEATELAGLEAAAHAAYGAGEPTGIVAAPGTQALIQLLPRIFPAHRVGVLGFTYQEHAAAWREAGADVTVVETLADLIGFDTGVVVNPNNPDGRIEAADDLAAVADALSRRGGRLIIDEAFMDLLGRACSLVPRLPASGAVVLRSFGKTYGLAGLRLGFAAASPEDCMRLRAAIGPWAVSGPAIAIGARALLDDAWLASTTRRLRGEADRLDRMLHSAGFEVVGGTTLFRLARHDVAAARFDHLCRTGILTRPFAARPDWLRFGIPSTSAEWDRLLAALAGG